ncbi:hypothetical protein [Salmonirosea aquatica]|uniref:Uncharacterized protein n=1 Tax=Salmonirosea aquatica TaxID=2654236 RepID=A0A7C9BV51_9BACT|nr:hypothetical protein [Cytophagaceae bacterium SJW1-29]
MSRKTTDGGQAEEKRAEAQVKFTGVFNGDSLSFEVPEGLEGTLSVKINEQPWGKSPLQSPLTVVRGQPLPATHRISFKVQSTKQQ